MDRQTAVNLFFVIILFVYIIKKQQQEERERELDSLYNADSASLSLNKIRIILERITNHLDGQAQRLAYNLIETLESLREFETSNCGNLAN